MEVGASSPRWPSAALRLPQFHSRQLRGDLQGSYAVLHEDELSTLSQRAVDGRPRRNNPWPGRTTSGPTTYRNKISMQSFAGGDRRAGARIRHVGRDGLLVLVSSRGWRRALSIFWLLASAAGRRMAAAAPSCPGMGTIAAGHVSRTVLNDTRNFGCCLRGATNFPSLPSPSSSARSYGGRCRAEGEAPM